MGFKTATHKIEGILGYVHLDIWGLMRTPSKGGAQYFMSFIDVISSIDYLDLNLMGNSLRKYGQDKKLITFS